MRALVYGTGEYFKLKRNAIKDKIIGFVNSFKTGKYEGLPLYTVKQISDIEYDVIYVMAKEKFFCEMVYALLNNGVHREKIIIGQNLEPGIYGENDFIGEGRLFFIDENNRLSYKVNHIAVAFSTYDEFYGIRDVFCYEDYKFRMNSRNGGVVVCDIGMNIGAASLYFAFRNDVIKVYSYEPFRPTYELGLYNIQRNHIPTEKLEMKNVGLSDHNAELEIMYNPSMTCGLSTNIEISPTAKEQYKIFGLYKEDSERMMKVLLIDVAEELKKIIQYNKQANLLVKIDCEGSEYEILQRLHEEDLLKYISIIMMEWHYRGETMIREILEENYFCFFSFSKGSSMGNIYAVNSRVEKNYEMDK